jgi:hypothetical protein
VFRLTITLCVWTFVAAPLVAGDAPAAEQDRIRGEVTRLLGQLDSDRFEVRQAAAQQLDQFVSKPELGGLLAGEFRRTLLRPDLSYEVRWRLNGWSRRLPAPPPEPVGEAAPDELDRLVRQLDDDSYAVRLGAAERLEWLTNNPKLVCPLMLLLKRRLAEATLSDEARRQLEAAWQRVRGAWLMSDSACPQLPAVSDEQIASWLDDLMKRSQPDGASHRELLDLLARDDYVPRLKAAIQKRLDANPDADAAARLQELHNWTKPAMVAEYWHGRRQLGQQHLLVDVPTMSPGAVKPTHFDRCDDNTAHYVSGNSLTKGDYPVGVAFPHPKQEDAVFDLVNLPTPRRRMAYDYYVRTSESKRLAALSRRTFDRFLTIKRPLTEQELVMLGQLDPVELSRFAGKYFMAVDDDRIPAAGLHRLGGRPSRFGMICVHLAIDGTKDALPGLTDAIAKGAFMPPSVLAPYRLPWLAALSIAVRDPWPDVDAWLAGRIDAKDVLVEGRTSSPELSATAAAVLLSRHGRTAAQFDLQPSPEPLLNKFQIDGYRFGSDESRKKVRQWWEEEKNKKKTP